MRYLKCKSKFSFRPPPFPDTFFALSPPPHLKILQRPWYTLRTICSSDKCTSTICKAGNFPAQLVRKEYPDIKTKRRFFLFEKAISRDITLNLLNGPRLHTDCWLATLSLSKFDSWYSAKYRWRNMQILRDRLPF